MRVIRSAAQSLAATLAAVAALSVAAVALGTAVFGMTVTGALALYFVVWWTALFAVLPFGARSQVEAGNVTLGSDPGAPALPALNEKAIWTTILAGLVFAIVGWMLPLAGL
jgi:predicted secreted protein